MMVTKTKAKTKTNILRPRTAYNFFYRHQRKIILEEKASFRDDKSRSWVEETFDIESSKRPHRKRHGLIGLEELTKTVAKRWKEADAETKEKYIALANEDKTRYMESLMSSSSNSIPWLYPQEYLLKSHETQHSWPFQVDIVQSHIDKLVGVHIPDHRFEKNTSDPYIEDNAFNTYSYTDELGLKWTVGELEILKQIALAALIQFRSEEERVVVNRQLCHKYTNN